MVEYGVLQQISWKYLGIIMDTIKQENIISLERNTKETQIKITLNLYGNGNSNIETGIGFFNHMLESFSKHALIDMTLHCKGDIFIDFHHRKFF